MPIHLRLAIIVSAAVIVGAVNQRYVNGRLATEDFVATRRDIPAGGLLKEGDLIPIRLGGDLGHLAELLVPWKQRFLVVENATLRQRKAGDLVVRRDVEQQMFGVYKGAANESVFSVDFDESLGVKRRLNIGSQFYVVVSRRAEQGQDTTEELGPFTLRQVGSLCKEVDQKIVTQMPGETFTLSCSKAPGETLPHQARLLIDATKNDRGSSVYAIYDASVAR